MKKISNYIFEKLHLNKETTSNEVRVIFCELLFQRKTKQIIPDLIEVISENEKEIEFKYLTNYYNQQGVIKKLRKDGYRWAKCPDSVFISTQYTTKHFCILNHDDGLSVLKDMLEKIKQKRTYKYCWEDVILDQNFNRTVGGYICYCSRELPKNKIPNGIYDTDMVTPDKLEDLINDL